MKRNKTLLLSALLCMPGLAFGDTTNEGTGNGLPTADCRWTFDNPDDVLAPSDGSVVLEPIKFATNDVQVKTLEEAGIASIDGPKATNRALRLPADAGFKSTLGLSAETMDYTLVMDVRVADVNPYDAIFSTTLTNSSDADMFISEGEIGVGSLGYGGTVTNNTWHRFIFVNRGGEFSAYIDGVHVNTAVNNRWTISQDGILFFADNDGESIETDVAEIAFWNTPLDEAQLSLIGLVDMDPFVDVLTPEVKVSYNLDFYVKLKTNVNVTFTTPDWIEAVDVAPASGTKDYIFRAKALTEGEERTGTIVISGEGIENREVTVTQIKDPAEDFEQKDGFLQLNTQEDFDKWVAALNEGTMALETKVDLNTDVTATSTDACIIANYSGVFDGNFHTVTLDVNSPNSSAAFVWNLWGTVENVYFEGKVEGSVTFLGTVAVSLQPGSLVQNVHSSVDIVSHVDGDGTHGGIAALCYGTTMRNVVYAGTMGSPEGTTNCCGGLIGWMSNWATIENCLMLGDMSGIQDYGSNTIARNQGNIGGRNLFATAHKNETPGSCAIVTYEQLTSGEVCFRLNGNSFANPSWFQNLDEGDEVPGFESSRGIVYPTTEGYATLFPDKAESFAAFVTNTSDIATAYLDSDDVTQYANTALTAEYAGLVAAYSNVTNMEELLAAYDAEKAKRGEVEASVAAYKNYEAAVNAIIAELGTHDNLYSDALSTLEEYLYGGLEAGADERMPNGSYEYIMENRLLGNAELEAEAAHAAELLRLAVSNSIAPGADVSALIVNADMSQPNFEGWTSLMTTTGGFNSAMGLAEFPAGEAYQTPFNLNQTLENVPNGVYELHVNAFFRWGDDWASRDEEIVPAVLYMNDFSTPIRNITSDMVSEDEAVDLENCYITTPGQWPSDNVVERDGKIWYAPNSVDGASYAFKAGRYQQTVYGLVSDGKLTLGLRDERSSSGAWVMFSNFRLIYQAKNTETMTALLEGMQKQADTYQAAATDAGETFYQGYYTNIQTMAAEFNATDDADAKYNLLIAINGELTKIAAGVDVYAELFAWLDKTYSSYYEALGTILTEEEVHTFEQEVYNPLIAALQDGTLTNEEAEAKIEELRKMPLNEVTPPTNRWTFDNPDDLLATAAGNAALQPMLLVEGVGIVDDIATAGITPTAGPSAENGAAHLPTNAALFSTLELTDNCQNYTLQLDIKVQDASNYNGIIQSDLTNSGDADLFYSGGQIGVGDLGYSGVILANKWQRIHCVNRNGEFTVYVDGQRCNTANNQRWIIRKEGLLFFADDDGERVDTDVAEIAFWDMPMTDFQIIGMSRVGDVATSIDRIEQKPAVQPAITGTYDLMGRKMNPAKLQKGIYIHNGKKVVVK